MMRHTGGLSNGKPPPGGIGSGVALDRATSKARRWAAGDAATVGLTDTGAGLELNEFDDDTLTVLEGVTGGDGVVDTDGARLDDDEGVAISEAVGVQDGVDVLVELLVAVIEDDAVALAEGVGDGEKGATWAVQLRAIGTTSVQAPSASSPLGHKSASV